jgi:hypothetical protein
MESAITGLSLSSQNAALNGGNLVALYSEIDERLFPLTYPVRTAMHREPKASAPPDLVKPGTGPP